MKNKNGCFFNIFMIFGLLALALAIAYKVVFFASYLNLVPDYLTLVPDELVFNWDEDSERHILVNTDANSWIIEYYDWAGVRKEGHDICIRVNSNDSRYERKGRIKIRSGYFGGLGNRTATLTIVQKGKRASFINVSEQDVLFSKEGDEKELRIDTDGGEWIVEICPQWINEMKKDNYLFLSTQKNTTGILRNGKIRLKSDEITKDINVSQEYCVLDIERVDMDVDDYYISAHIDYYGYKDGLFNLCQKIIRNCKEVYSTCDDMQDEFEYVYIKNGYNEMELETYMDGYSSGEYSYEVWVGNECVITRNFRIQ